ncbi:MAG: hypothetical protein RL215_1001, partial [Planctomycetota bacterium]
THATLAAHGPQNYIVWHIDPHLLIQYNVRQIATSCFGAKVMTSARADSRINVRLPGELKRTIEEAAAALGQSVSEFTISTVVQEARHVLEAAQVTRLSLRDRDRFLAALDDVDATPNAALKAAAQRYGNRRA